MRVFVHEAKAGDLALEAMAGGAGSGIGRGGMLTKILAAKRAASSGAHTVIAWGREENVLIRLAAGESIGTQLTAQTGQLTARKQWMADHLQTAGQCHAGCRRGAEADGGRQIAVADRRHRRSLANSAAAMSLPAPMKRAVQLRAA